MSSARNRSQAWRGAGSGPSRDGQGEREPALGGEPANDRLLDDAFDAEVPAAVVCAHCGDADCPGCAHELTRSGVVAIVPWERPGATAVARLWATARATALDSDRFFESLPDGPLAPALRFAVASELLATTSMALLLLAPVALLAPHWLRHLIVEESAFAVRLGCLGVPALAAVLVTAHVAHGWALDLGARRAGARGATKRAVRFGLYAAGWDLVVGPLGALIVAVREGPGKASAIAGLGMELPTRSARAFLRGCYRLDGAAADPALRVSYVGAGVATVLGAVAFIAGLAAALLL
jgi:hypothetical protein